MNGEIQNERSGPAYFLAVLGAFLIVAGLVWAMKHYTLPSPLGEDRAAVRAKALAELRAAEAEALNTTGWVDASKGIVRLRIEDAMAWVQQNWGQNPAAARSNLISRVDKATAPPPRAPEKPSQFE
ncbi:MAG TPA: hypothetical protein VKY92_17780 [Verrucomicrobiae bacterium]|nr:hypothetical protein [Verrucomicrobiae bacterium]